MCKVFFSINNHQIATPEMMLEEARSYIMFFHEAKNKISAYIGLHLLLTDRKLYYAHSSNPFPEEELDAVQEEALNFTEGLGAMLDELDFTHLAHGEAKRWIDKQDIFKSIPETQSTPETKTPEAVQAEPPVEQQSLAGPAPVTEQAMPSQVPLQPLSQPAPAAPDAQLPQLQQLEPSPMQQVSPSQPQPMPVAPTPQVPPVHPAPQQVLPVAPEVQHPQPKQPALTTSQYQEEKSAYTEPFEQAPMVRKKENQRTQRTMGAGLPGTHANPPSRAAGPKAPPSSAPKDREEIFQQAIRSGFVKVTKQSGKKGSRLAAGVVSRDREALARLLTSF